jgi:tetratricopeptide (TPR) repeat protein/predicted Ser/Thr protein kinase
MQGPDMDCPNCKTRNPLGAESCSNCHTALGGNAGKIVAALTPPAEIEGPTLVARPPVSSPSDSEATLVGSDASSMAIPTAWSVPSSQRSPVGGASLSLASVRPGVLLGNRYEIVATLGQGGMGAVYKARDRELDRMVALKVIRPELAGQPDILQRFKQELILARKVTHRNVIRIFDLGDADGIKFITMEFIEGRDLKSLLVEKGKLAPDQAVEIMQQVCLALEAAHSEGVVHRDLKPQNIMVDQQGRTSVMDFGIARSLELGGMTQTGALIGTPEYMSPEQVRGEHVDARSDLFTLGVIFQEILTGTPPFQAETAMASMFKRTMERAVSVHQLNPGIPQYLSDIVAKCLEIQPQDRFQTAREIYDALEAWKRGAAKPLIVPSLRWVHQAKQLPWRWIASGLALALLVVTAFMLRVRFSTGTAAPHSPVTVMIADFSNHTGDPIFDGTLEPMLKLALEGAGFISAYDRTQMRSLGVPAISGRLDEQAATKIAVSQGLGVVVSGSLERQGSGYGLTLKATQAVTGQTITNSGGSAANKDQVLFAVTKIATTFRKALGDNTSESAQRFAMDTLSATSLEAVHEYALAMEALDNNKYADALRSFSRAADLDPNFGLADAGKAIASRNLGENREAEKYIKEAITHIDRMTERERYRTRAMFYFITADYQKCVEEYGALITRYPSDVSAHNNLGICYGYLRNIPKTIEEIRRASEILPKRLQFRFNLAAYESLAGDFQTAERDVRMALQMDPSYEQGYLILAIAQLGQNQLSQADDTYHTLEKVSSSGRSFAASGLADLATYEGRYSDAVKILEDGAAADLSAKQLDRAAEKFAPLAYIQLLRGQKGPAVAAAESALANSKEVKVRLLVGLIFAQLGETAKARALANGLSSELQIEPQAYAKLIAGELALKAGSARDAIKLFTEANALLDTWIGRFDRGRAYLDAGAFAEADSEFDQCIKRRGEAILLFMDEVPTYGYFPPVYYYQGRVREGLKSSGFADSYRAYLNIREQAAEDPLLAEVRRRAGK